jgi:hypothetical protein
MEENNTFENYYNTLVNETPEEIAVREEIKKLEESFNETPEYKEYKEKKDALYEKLRVECNIRHQKAKALRPARKSISIEDFADMVRDNRKQRFAKLPEAAKKMIKGFLALPKDVQREMKDIVHIGQDIDKISEKNRVTTDKDIWELQAILAQTCEDFIAEKGLSDIYGIHFTATDFGGIMDATTYVDGIEYDEASEMNVRKEIGWTCF